uniref:trimethyllysine dioxygenase n=1 Tax=Alexandrium monilatum TaxID=311494 RepID=A0A7S4TAU1_9DINO
MHLGSEQAPGTRGGRSQSRPTLEMALSNLKTMRSRLAPLIPSTASRFTCSLLSAEARGQNVDVSFRDGSAFRFHSLWLRDACRDPFYVSAAAGEKILSRTPLGARCPADLAAKSVKTEDDSHLRVEWSDGSNESLFSANFLRAYADEVAKPLAAPTASTAADDIAWIKPYSGVPGALAPADEMMDLWANGPDNKEFPRISRADVAKPEGNLSFLKELMRHGVVIVDEVPDAEDSSVLLEFAKSCMGGLQKDPAREEANWKIVKKDGAASISYNQDMRLNQHTDQSIPGHGIPALVLIVHYMKGYGVNTLTDGFACAKALRERDPEAFELLATYGNDQERDFIRSRVDADQNHNQSLLISTKAPILQLDSHGNLTRLQYNEVFRTPSTLPYDVFTKWYAAYRKFVDMVHSPEFERCVRMEKNQILVMQNWRVMHGRGNAAQSPDRTLVGGTVTREAVYSRARQLLEETSGRELFGAELLVA